MGRHGTGVSMVLYPPEVRNSQEFGMSQVTASGIETPPIVILATAASWLAKALAKHRVNKATLS